MAVDFDELELRLMREFLETATSVEWFVTACTMNYDGNSDLILWMAAHPLLDRATATALYWYSQPGYYQRFRTESEVPSVNRNGWRIVHALQERVTSGTIGRPGVSYDPANDPSPIGDATAPGYDWTAEALTEQDGPAWLIPAQLSQPVPGEYVDADVYATEAGWDGGMPPSVIAVLEETLRTEGETE